MDLTIARAIKRKTQWALGKETGIHQSKISLIEHGYISPSNKEKAAISKALGLGVTEIQWPEHEDARQ